MASVYEQYHLYLRQLHSCLAVHDVAVSASDVGFSAAALAAAGEGNWDVAAVELTRTLARILGPVLSPAHAFADRPHIRRIELPNGRPILIGIINQQAAEWYGRDDSIAAFDFLHEAQRGVFDGCNRFLDLGGHHMVWASFYAMTSETARVTTFEPSILNVAIGLFNCLVNGVADRVQVVPFAVLASDAPDDSGDAQGMLVDFMTVPLRAKKLRATIDGLFDFVKTDIEGYEYQLLLDPDYVRLLSAARNSHLELHLGHLVGRGIVLSDWIDRLRTARISGTELYSRDDMYAFLAGNTPDGFYSFLVKAT